MKQILIIEDEEKIARVLRDYLEREGYAVHHLAEGAHAVERISSNPPDCIILDLMLPGKDGMTICREVRTFSEVPIIMLTARVEEIDRLLGLELGADDYVCKPFSPREVVARVKVILRRLGRQMSTTQPHHYAELELRPERHECYANGAPLDLTPVEFRLLSRLLSQPGRVYSRTELMDGAYDDHRVVSDRTIDSHMKNLRKKLTQAGAEDDRIRSIYGVGYKLE